MKVTNKFGLPDTIVNVLARPTYSKGKAHISATELINSPRIVQLKRMHWDDIEEDASAMVWSLFGSAIHNILEHGKDEHHIVEERLHITFDGWGISGAIDLQEVYEDGIVISDYKTTTAWAVQNDKPEWAKQLNIYSWLVQKAKKVNVKGLRIVAIIRDWSSRDAVNREGYPQSPIVILEQPLWDFNYTEQFILDRLKKHGEAYFESETDGNIEACTADEMWEKQTTYAVIKVGGKRAKSVHSIKSEADLALTDAGKGYEIQVRPGERTRCASYCQVSRFCSQYQKYLEENTSEETTID
jgi:hypothetical protein